MREVHPAALYVHCSAHSLNLALAHSSNIHHIRNCIGTIKSVGNFIKISAKRTELLKNKIKEFLPQTKWTKLTSMCETRWVENHDGMLRFSEIYKPIVATLEELQLFVDIETSSKALQLYKCVTISEFIISMITATTLFSITLPLCKILQSVKCDLSEAVDHVETVLSEKEKIKIPRLVSRSTNRINVDTKIPEDYFRIAIAIPFYDDFISQPKERFSKHKTILSSLYLLIPKMCLKSPILESDFSVYSDFINVDELPSELKLWKRKWIAFKDVDRPHTAVEALNYCNPEFFANIHFLLKVLATLPVSTATSDRTFSTLKRVKTFLRNSTGQEILTGLALLSVHRDVTREDRNRPEDAVLMLDLRDFHLQKIVIKDTPIFFLRLNRDLFSALYVPRKLDLEFEKQVRQVTIYLKLQPEDNLGLKVVKLVELLEVRHSIFIIGLAGTSEMCKTLYRTYVDLKFKPYINDIEPKAVTNDELLGVISPPTREWVDGLLSYLIKDESQISGDGSKLMLNYDGMDPINIRSSRSVFNYFIDSGSKQLLPWSDLDLVSSFELNPDIPLQSHTLNRQFMDYYHWYDRTKSYLKYDQNVMFASGMSPAAESFTLDSRLQRNFYVFALSEFLWVTNLVQFDEETLEVCQIYRILEIPRSALPNASLVGFVYSSVQSLVYSKVLWEYLTCLFGEIVHGGHITEDWARRLCLTHLKVNVNPDEVLLKIYTIIHAIQ
ncbi:hypothetical protein QTP88_027182 [Uroleucon formosanum]